MCVYVLYIDHVGTNQINFVTWWNRTRSTLLVDIKVVLRLRMTYLGHLRAIAPTGMIN